MAPSIHGSDPSTNKGSRRSRERLGFVGTGTLAASLAQALSLCSTPAPDILLSPRSAIRTEELSRRFDNIARAASNHEVVARAGIVFLGVRPKDFPAAVRKLPFRAGQTIVSLLAGVSLASVANEVKEAQAVRLLTLPSIASGHAPLIIYPRNEALLATLAPLGSVIAVQDEAKLNALFMAAAFMSTFLELQSVLANKLVERGLPAVDADKFVNLMLDGLVRTAGASNGQTSKEIVEGHETPGGLNGRCRKWMHEAGWFSQVHTVFEQLEKSKI